MLTYALHCTVCDNNFFERESWTRHLFQEDHQRKARLEYEEWEEAKKACALTAFFSCPVNEEDNDDGSSYLVVLLWNYLKRTVDEDGVCEGRGRGSSSSLLITDFIWWRESPTIAIVQFENWEKANQVYTKVMNVGGASTGAPVKIGNCFVQFKKLVENWAIPLPDSRAIGGSRPPPPLPRPKPATSPGPPPDKKPKIEAPSSASSCCSSDDFADFDYTENNNQPSSIPIPSTSSSALTLVTQLKRILKSVEIPASEFQQAINIVDQVKALISSKYPSCQVFLFRHNFLKIRNPFCNDILIFAHGGPTSTNPAGYQKLDICQVAKWAVVKAPTLDYFYEETPKYKDSQLFRLLSGSGSGQPICQFWMVTDEAYLLEAQLNRLMEYMMTFDPKCGLLLSCLHYFCTLNSCYFDDSPSKSETMEWILIFFLSKEKVIPTVREILAQPHQPIMLPNSERNIDIGFNPDPDFATKWKKSRGEMTKETESFTHEYVCDVLNLFLKFLRFVRRTLPHGLILNVRDAENLNRKQVLFQLRGQWTTQLPLEEIEIIKSNPAHVGQSNKMPFHIVHPLAVHLNLGYNKARFLQASLLMKWGVFHLDRFLNQRKEVHLEMWLRRKGALPEFYKDLESVFKIELVPKKGKRKVKKGKAKKVKVKKVKVEKIKVKKEGGGHWG